MNDRGLVLGCGGVAGIAWLTGLLVAFPLQQQMDILENAGAQT